MADNATLPASGVTVATDEIAGVHHQLVKVEYGAPDSATPVSVVNGLPVQPASGVVFTVETELPNPGTLSDGLANPNTVTVGAGLMNFNGQSWDRARNNTNETTGDTGVKTASFNGATQTNFNARGAYITLLIGTVTGTNPKLSVQPQWSPDGGLNWVDLDGTVDIAATGNYGFLIYPTAIAKAGAGQGTLSTGLTSTQVQLNAPLPRTWRLKYTLTGNGAIVTINAVHVNYVI